MKQTINKITELTNEWRTLVAKDHCKDRDFHFYIETKWSYGQPPKYSVLHHGYILHDFEGEQYDTYEEALNGLINFLSKAIEEEKVDSNLTEEF